MTTARRTRTRRRPHRLVPRPPSVLEGGELAHLRSWSGVRMTVQLPTTTLSAGRLPALVVGEVLELSPIFYMADYVPVGPSGYGSPGDDEGDWWCGEAGTVRARGDLVAPDLEDDGALSFLLDVAGRWFPLNWTNPAPFLTPMIDANGALYLDPCVEPGGPLESAGRRCRASLRVVDVRRYRRVDGEPRDPTSLERVPDPWDVDDSVSYVADLVEAR